MRSPSLHLSTTLGISVALVACQSNPPLFVPIDTFEGADFLFTLVTDRAGRVVRTEGPLLLDGSPSSPLAGAVGDGTGAETWIVTYRESDIERVFPLYDREGRGTVRLGLASLATCGDAVLDPRFGTAQIRAPAPVGIWRLGEAGFAAQEVDESSLLRANALTLTLRFDAERCIEPAARTLTNFAAAEVPVPVGTVIFGQPQIIDALLYMNAHRLEDDRLLLMSLGWLFLVERGAAFQATATTAALVGPGALVLLVDEHPSRHGGRTRVVVTTRGSDDRPPRWHELEVGTEGLRLISTATLASTVTSLELDADTGRIVAVTDGGAVLGQSARGESLVHHGARFAVEDGQPILARTGWPTWPYALTGAERGQVVAVSPDLARTELLTSNGVDSSARYRTLATLGTTAGPRLFIANNKGELHWLEPELNRWVRHPMRFPPDYDCGSGDACGFSLQGLALRGLIPHRRGGVERFYAAVNDCMTVLDVRTDGLCGGYLRIPGRADLRPAVVTLQDGTNLFNVRAIHLSASGWLTVASQEGGVYEMFTGSEPAGLD